MSWAQFLGSPHISPSLRRRETSKNGPRINRTTSHNSSLFLFATVTRAFCRNSRACRRDSSKARAWSGNVRGQGSSQAMRPSRTNARGLGHLAACFVFWKVGRRRWRWLLAHRKHSNASKLPSWTSCSSANRARSLRTFRKTVLVTPAGPARLKARKSE